MRQVENNSHRRLKRPPAVRLRRRLPRSSNCRCCSGRANRAAATHRYTQTKTGITHTQTYRRAFSHRHSGCCTHAINLRVSVLLKNR
ncbi:MAG: hypothetical protein U0401_13110 [Anaerolineae bacterium]